MAIGLNGVIAQLEQQKAAIEKALAALRGIEGGSPTTGAPTDSAPAPRKGGMSPEGKQRLIAALKKRWAAEKRAATKAAASAPAPSPATPAKRKGGGMTPEGRKRLAEAMKRRWAVKRAASAVKKVGRKKAA